MKIWISRLLITLMLLAIGAACPVTAAAEDITVHVPLRVTNIPTEFADKMIVHIDIMDATKNNYVASVNQPIPIANGQFIGTLAVKFNYDAAKKAQYGPGKYYLAYVMAATGGAYLLGHEPGDHNRSAGGYLPIPSTP